jgi:hypothetical protein
MAFYAKVANLIIKKKPCDLLTKYNKCKVELIIEKLAD